MLKKGLKFHSFKIQIVLELKQADFLDVRCNCHIFGPDEAQYHLNRLLNQAKLMFLATKKRKHSIETSKTIVWAPGELFGEP